jgi:hypothetical protein
LVKITAVSYAEEIGTFLGQDPERRWLLKFDFGFNL